MSLRELVADDSCATGAVGQADSHSYARNPLGQFFQQFVDSSRTQQHVREIRVPAQFSPLQQEKIRNRTNVMPRQFFPGKLYHYVSIIFA